MIPKPLLAEILADPAYRKCSVPGCNGCGKVEQHHCFTYGGKDVQEKWAIVSLGHYHHQGAGKTEGLRVAKKIALERAKRADLSKYPLLLENNRPKICPNKS